MEAAAWAALGIVRSTSEPTLRDVDMDRRTQLRRFELGLPAETVVAAAPVALDPLAAGLAGLSVGVPPAPGAEHAACCFAELRGCGYRYHDNNARKQVFLFDDVAAQRRDRDATARRKRRGQWWVCSARELPLESLDAAQRRARNAASDAASTAPSVADATYATDAFDADRMSVTTGSMSSCGSVRSLCSLQTVCSVALAE
jgi:hypothetical protein